MGTKGINAIRFGFKLLAGISAGYFMDRAMEKKANELVSEGGMLNAFTIGVGQGALDMAVGTLVFWIVG